MQQDSEVHRVRRSLFVSDLIRLMSDFTRFCFARSVAISPATFLCAWMIDEWSLPPNFLAISG